MKFLANLFGGGQEGVVRYALATQKAVRWHRRAETVGDIDRETADRMLREANCTREEADAIYKLTALCTECVSVKCGWERIAWCSVSLRRFNNLA